MAAKVVDASVLGALLFGKPSAQKAFALLQGAELYAPTLLRYELTSIAYKKISSYPKQREGLIAALRVGLLLDLHQVEVDHEAALQLALATGLTPYEASYLVLARTLGAPLVTFDKRLQKVLEE
ncbi:MAG: type II toxin-antitoxin system VapC family toxin [Candidatus Bipolaricaulota bacterium]|nr:type II toxin-antitoxin system VapC family toxin [Candidatus Bipolaricaulota bacterium]MDW8329136.1 type II toxin-antitoxin system VapC family toxin [Candidatus Bipolaricaulota bacterium]